MSIRPVTSQRTRHLPETKPKEDIEYLTAYINHLHKHFFTNSLSCWMGFVGSDSNCWRRDPIGNYEVRRRKKWRKGKWRKGEKERGKGRTKVREDRIRSKRKGERRERRKSQQVWLSLTFQFLLQSIFSFAFPFILLPSFLFLRPSFSLHSPFYLQLLRDLPEVDEFTLAIAMLIQATPGNRWLQCYS